MLIISLVIAFFFISIFFLVNLGNKVFEVFIVDLEKDNIQLFWKEKDGNRFASIERLKSHLEHQGKNLIFATNAGIFDDDEIPVGLHIENGEILRPIDFDEETGIFYIKPNGVFYIENNQAHVIDSVHFDTSKKVDMAVQSGPMLVLNGKVNPDFREYTRNVLIRNGVGIISPTKVAFVISQERVSFSDMARFFKETLHCQNALSLDVDVSKMYVKNKREEDLDGNLAGIIAVVK